MKAKDSALRFEFWSDFFYGGGYSFLSKYFPPTRKNQNEIQNSNPYILSAESLAFISRKDFVDKRIIGGEIRV